MAADPQIALCINCELRPRDPATRRFSPDGMRIAERPLDESVTAVVIYSEEDPRINAQFRLAPDTDSSTAIRYARDCTPVVEGARVSGRVVGEGQRTNIDKAKHCRMARVVLCHDGNLPQDLLYETGRQ